jgi:hypothetical protein
MAQHETTQVVRIEHTATGAWRVIHFETRVGVHRGPRAKAREAALRHARRLTSGGVLVVDNG